MSIELIGGKNLIFECAQRPTPRTAEDEVDWSRVHRIKILRIEGYDD